jgi:2-keto-4-pentenoate hydratase/2-oxohepta-3-ene-1,7-dioic acid hydratase in catechol pathway
VRLATVLHQGRPRIGRVSDDARRIALVAGEAPLGLLPVIESMAAGGRWPDTVEEVALDPRALRAPLPRPPRNLFCVGRNYHAHAAELRDSVFKGSAAKVDTWPIVFTKVPETVTGPYADVPLPGAAVSEQIDYEAELTLVVGRGGRNIRRADALSHVFGYTIVNDVTARDVQMRHSQWDLGKSIDAFCPMGPWLVTADELAGREMRVRCFVNGELRQDASTSQLIFDIPTLIETCSRGITLRPGDVIATGTPAGVGMGLTPPRWLRAGDVVRCEVSGIGAIENRFVGEENPA